MTDTSPHIIAAQAHAGAIVDLRGQLDAKTKRRNAVASDQATAVRTIEKLKAQIQADGVAAILADIPYDPPADLARQLRKATASAAPCGPALAVLDSEIVALRNRIDEEERGRVAATFSYSSDLQRGYAESFKAGLVALMPHLAALAAVDTLRARHTMGAMASVPAGGSRPWQSTVVISNLLKNLPTQLRPESLNLEVIQRAALTHIATIESELNGDAK